MLTQAQQPSFLPVRVSKVEFCVDHFEICLGWFSSLFSAVCFVFIHKNEIWSYSNCSECRIQLFIHKCFRIILQSSTASLHHASVTVQSVPGCLSISERLRSTVSQYFLQRLSVDHRRSEKIVALLKESICQLLKSGTITEELT